ncbi:Cyclic nucleotide-binding domain-containing protein [Mariprofundus ferrinatatus]|uniref:Cyclic nucleotide-binding domain-containing protein n=1 Tax=Mariprofundus ferrinatatus TaxID=1921087 RepID=A0A2K8L305_9PROT|nr:cyclic nucleotide-binding domain-containing protein [Mariprofundus ferrinatatus]ATX81633.1 Cyclic nucleotide-binding domain-containing protein [Mariprofundus ferrinatatus]
MIHEIVDLMQAIPMFDKTAGSQLNVIAAHMNILKLEEKEQLFSEGEKSDYMCFVVSGKLEVIKRADSGKPVTVSTLTRGRSIGEMALLDTYPRSATVIAKTPCTLLIISREKFDNILEQYPAVGISFLKGVSEMLSLQLRKASGLLADAS